MRAGLQDGAVHNFVARRHRVVPVPDRSRRDQRRARRRRVRRCRVRQRGRRTRRLRRGDRRSSKRHVPTSSSSETMRRRPRIATRTSRSRPRPKSYDSPRSRRIVSRTRRSSASCNVSARRVSPPTRRLPRQRRRPRSRVARRQSGRRASATCGLAGSSRRTQAPSRIGSNSNAAAPAAGGNPKRRRRRRSRSRRRRTPAAASSVRSPGPGRSATPGAQPFGRPQPRGRRHDVARSAHRSSRSNRDSVQFKTTSLGGNSIWVNGASGTRYFYAHLSAWEGSSRNVSQGEVIGYVGATGNTTANHLHFEVHPAEGLRSTRTPTSAPSADHRATRAHRLQPDRAFVRV